MSVSYLDKKWVWITPLQTTWKAPQSNEPFTQDSDRNFTRLVQADAYHINYFERNEIPMDADIYVLASFDIGNLDKEIIFAQKIKELGKKLIVCYSADLRFLLGNCFISSTGNLYTELCKYADVILSGVGEDIQIYGRYSNKVMSYGLAMERLNFSEKPYEQREIDILISGSAGIECFAFELEVLLMIKEEYPNLNIVHSSQEPHREYMKKFKDMGITFVHEYLISNLLNSKLYLNLEIRPRGGRALLDAWMCRTPFISCDSTFYSQLFPDLSYGMKFNMNKIVDKYISSRDYKYNDLIKKAEEIAEPLYFDNTIVKLMSELYKNK